MRKTTFLTSTALAAFCCHLPLTTANVHAGTSGKEPSAAVIPAHPPQEDNWSFTIRPYGWLTGLDGSTGVGALTTNVDIDFAEVFDHLNAGFFLQAEARKGRFGILFDGFFADLSGAGTPPGPLYKEADFSLQQTYAEIAIAYRLIEGPAGFLDVFAGARYNSLELDLHAAHDDAGIRSVSTNSSERIVDEIQAKVSDAVDSKRAAISTAASNRVRSLETEITREVAERLRKPQTLDRKLHSGGRPGSPLPPIHEAIQDEIRDLVRAKVEARVAGVRAEVRRRIDARVAAAEKKLASAIEKELKNRLPESAAAKKDWVDPLVGLRGQWNITEQIYLAGRADIGGFGVGSELTWQASAALGWQINSSWSTEAGYRYLAPDFEDGDFRYEVDSNGFFVSLGYTF